MKRKKYQEIEDINQATGVTPEQLLGQCEYLMKIMKESYCLNDVEKQEAVHNAVIFILKKMEQGTVNKYQYSEFKNYLFITLRNAFVKAYMNRNTLTAKVINESVDEEYIPEDLTDENPIDYSDRKTRIFQSVLAEMPQKKRQIIEMLFSGAKYNDVMKKFGCKRYHIANEFHRFKTRCRDIAGFKKDKRKIYETDIPEEIVKRVQQGISRKEIAKELNVTLAQIGYYIKSDVREKRKNRKELNLDNEPEN